MKSITFLVFLFFSFTSHVFAEKVSNPSNPLTSIAKKIDIEAERIILVEMSKEELSLTYFSQDDEEYKVKSVDLGLKRLNHYLLRELKRKDPKVFQDVHPVTLGQLKSWSQFVTIQIANVFTGEVFWNLISGHFEIVFIDESLDNELSEFVRRPYSLLWDDETSRDTLLSHVDLSADDLKKKGFIEPNYDFTRILLGYNIFKYFGFHSVYLFESSKDE